MPEVDVAQDPVPARPPFKGHRQAPARVKPTLTSQLPPSIAAMFVKHADAPTDPDTASTRHTAPTVVDPVDPNIPCTFAWAQWDTGYETGETSFTAAQIGLADTAPFTSIGITAHRDGTFYISAIEEVNLLEFRGEMTSEEWETWLEENDRQVRTFFRTQYEASLDIHPTITPGELPAARWSSVSASVGTLVTRETITPAEAFHIVLRETAIAHVHDDAKVTGGLGKRLRDHIANTVVIASDSALVFPASHGASDREAIRRALIKFVDQEIRDRGENRIIGDAVAVGICRTLDERYFPVLARFASIGMGSKDQLLAELSRAAAFTRDRAGLKRLEVLSLYFLHGADNRP